MKKKKRGRHPILDLKGLLGRIGTLNIILFVVGVFFVWFNWQMIQLAWSDKGVPETYACAVVAATIGEAGICGWIRTNKDRHMERKWEEEDRKEARNGDGNEGGDIDG